MEESFLISNYIKLKSILNSQLEIFAINSQLSKKFSILINPKKFIEINKAFQQNYDLLIDKLTIVRNRLMIVAPSLKVNMIRK